MYTEEDMFSAEEEIAKAISYFEHDKRTPHLDQKWRSKAKNAVVFLKENFPESEMLNESFKY